MTRSVECEHGVDPAHYCGPCDCPGEGKAHPEDERGSVAWYCEECLPPELQKKNIRRNK